MTKFKHTALNGSLGKYRSESPKTNAELQDEATDIERWRLLDDRGRQTWHYLESDEEVQEWPQSIADRYHLGLKLVSISGLYIC